MDAREGAPVMANMTVFDAFPNAIETWKIIPVAYSTITGNQLDIAKAQEIDVIVDEGSSSDANQSPNFATINSDTLIYTKPAQMPTTDTSALVADYAIKSPDGKIYEITDAGLGKNQEKGIIEHIELKIKQTEAEDAES